MSRRASGSKSDNIRSQILKAMGLLLLLFALVIGVNFYILTKTPGQGSTLFSPGSKIDQLTLNMKDYLLSSQNNAHLFLLNRDISKSEEHNVFIDKLLASAKKLKKVAEKDNNSQGVSATNEVINHIESYRKTFQKLTEEVVTGGVDSSSGLRGQLNTAGSQFSSFTSRNEAGDLALALLRVQLAQKDYLKNWDKVSLQKLTTSVDQLKQVANESQVDPLEAQILRKSLKKYIISLDKHQAVSLGSNDPKLATSLVQEEKRQVDAMRREVNEIELLINRVNVQVTSQLTAMNESNHIKSLISRVNVPNASNLAINVRRHETDYLLYGEDKSVDKFDNALDALIKAYNNSSILMEHKRELVQAAKQYSDTFKSFVENNKSIVNLTSQLDQNASTLLAQINDAVQKTAIKSDSGHKNTSPGSDINQLALLTVGAGLLVLIVGLLIAVLLAKSISAPITSITQILRRIVKDQDFTVEIPVTSKNETGLLAMELNELIQLKQNEPQQAIETHTALSPNMDELAGISASLSNHLKNLTEINNQVIDSTSDHDSLNVKAEAAIIRITESVNEIKQLLQKQVEPEEPTHDPDPLVNRSVETTLDSIKAVSQSTSQISDLINLSSDIAEQTNLLALNATVKAARAGAQSKEFSLVADEIAKLAQRSEGIAKEAGQLTNDLVGKIEDSATLVDDFNKSLKPVQHVGDTRFISDEVLSSQVEAIDSFIDELNKVLENCNIATEKIRSSSEEQSKETIAAQNAVSMLIEKTSLSESDQEKDTTEPDEHLTNPPDNMSTSDEDSEGVGTKPGEDNDTQNFDSATRTEGSGDPENSSNITIK